MPRFQPLVLATVVDLGGNPPRIGRPVGRWWSAYQVSGGSIVPGCQGRRKGVPVGRQQGGSVRWRPAIAHIGRWANAQVNQERHVRHHHIGDFHEPAHGSTTSPTHRAVHPRGHPFLVCSTDVGPTLKQVATVATERPSSNCSQDGGTILLKKAASSKIRTRTPAKRIAAAICAPNVMLAPRWPRGHHRDTCMRT